MVDDDMMTDIRVWKQKQEDAKKAKEAADKEAGVIEPDPPPPPPPTQAPDNDPRGK